MLQAILISVVAGFVVAFLVFRNNPLWLFPWRKMKSHKADAKAFLRERLDRL